MTTPLRRLADTILGSGIDTFIAERRARSPRTPWRVIARELYDATDGQIDVTPETLRKWATASQVAA